MINSKILVLHVKKGYEDRQKHIEKMMKSWGYSFEYILDGDMDDPQSRVCSSIFYR